MEPTDLKSTPPDDARLEAWYRANVSSAPLPDDGFSQRVLSALPAPAKHSTTKRWVFCLGGALIGIAIALIGTTTSGSLPSGLPAIAPALAEALAQLATPAVGWALGITAVSLWFAFRRGLRPLLKI